MIKHKYASKRRQKHTKKETQQQKQPEQSKIVLSKAYNIGKLIKLRHNASHVMICGCLKKEK